MDENLNGSETPLGEQVKQQTQQAVQQGQQIAGQVADKARATITDQLSKQKSTVAGAADHLDKALRAASGQLREAGQPAIGQVGELAADRVASVATYLNENELEDILTDTNEFARANPAMFLGLAVMLGALAARFVKSTGKAALPSPANGTYAMQPNGSSAGSQSGDTRELSEETDGEYRYATAAGA